MRARARARDEIFWVCEFVLAYKSSVDSVVSVYLSVLITCSYMPMHYCFWASELLRRHLWFVGQYRSVFNGKRVRWTSFTEVSSSLVPKRRYVILVSILVVHLEVFRTYLDGSRFYYSPMVNKTQSSAGLFANFYGPFRNKMFARHLMFCQQSAIIGPKVRCLLLGRNETRGRAICINL